MYLATEFIIYVETKQYGKMVEDLHKENSKIK